MIDHLLRDFQVLRKADFLVAKIWLNFLARRLGLVAFACLIALFGLGMANLAGFYALQTAYGPVWAASVVALVDLAIAAVVLVVSGRSRPGPELELAFDVRTMAVDALQADARELKLTLDAIAQEVRIVGANVAQFVQNPLDVAAQKLLVPAVLSILRAMRSHKDQA